jgi:hypothetical protein
VRVLCQSKEAFFLDRHETGALIEALVHSVETG